MAFIWQIDNDTNIEMKVKAFGHNDILCNGKKVENVTGKKKHRIFHLFDGRKVEIKIVSSAFSQDCELRVNGEVFLRNNQNLLKNCPKCETEVQPNDQFCQNCGEKFDSREVQLHKSKVKGTRTTMFVLAGIFVISGLLFFFIQSNAADQALDNIKDMDANAYFPEEINGKKVTVGELRQQIAVEKWGVLFINVFLAIIYIGLAFWAKKKPLGAILVALALYISVQVLNAIVDPQSIAQGLIMKMIIIGFLVKGLKSATSLRAAKDNA